MVATLWPFGPNIRRSPYIVTREFRTEIITSRSGKEQRRAMRNTPRKRIEYITARTEECLRAFDHSMVSAQRTLLAIPERVRFELLPFGIISSSADVIMDSVPEWIVVGAKLVLVYGDRYAKRTVSVIVGTTVTFDEFDAEAWPVNTRIHPALEGYLVSEIESPNIAKRGVYEISVSFEVDPGTEEPELEGIATTTLLGREVLLVRPDSWTPINIINLQEGAGVVDYGFGRTKSFFPIAFATRTFQGQYTPCDYDKAEILRKFFARMKGMRGEFHMPTWTPDMIPAFGIGALANALIVEGTETYNTFVGSTTHKAIGIRLKTGVWLVKKINSMGIVSGNTNFVVSSAWGTTAAISEIDMICWLPVWRFGSDILSMSWPFEDIAQLSFAFRMIEDLTVEV